MTTRRRRVYVAGAYSASDVLQVLRNMKRGMRLATEAFQAGVLPFAPWFDYHFFLQEDETKGRLTIEDIYQYSMSFLDNWAEAVLVQQQGWVESKGTVAEINRAEELGLPVFFTLESLMKWVAEQDAQEAVSEMTQEAQNRGEYEDQKQEG